MNLKKDTPLERIINGIYAENPVFCLILGMCPTLATTTSAVNGLGMGLSTTIILTLAELIISLLRKIIPDRMRMPAYIVVIASFVTMVDFLMEGFTPGLYKSLGIYIPLIVVNCIILGRAEAWAYSNGPLSSFFDGLGMGLGFTAGITCIGLVRELIGAGELFSHRVMPAAYEGAAIFVMAPGAFFVLAFLVALMNKLKVSRKNSGCGMDCAECGGCDK